MTEPQEVGHEVLDLTDVEVDAVALSYAGHRDNGGEVA